MNKHKNAPKPALNKDYQKLFDDYLKYQRELSLSYRQQLCRVTKSFLDECFGSGVIDLSQLSAKKVRNFMSHSANHASPRHTQNIACALRALLRFLYMNNFISTDLSKAIPRVAVEKLEVPYSYSLINGIRLMLNKVDRKKLKSIKSQDIDLESLRQLALPWPLPLSGSKFETELGS